MNSFTIESESSWYTNPVTNTRRTGIFIRQSISAFYHSEYSSGGQWKVPGTIENIICTLKNDITPYTSSILQNASQQLARILSTDLPLILQKTGKTNLTVCVIPRAKISYNPNQLLFRATVSEVANKLAGFSNGTNYIIRHTDTQTTHLSRGISGGGNGKSPYPGITKETCSISEDVKGKDILLIDDLYTKTVNIDEDSIQALLDKGAKSVVFYAVGNTKPKTVEVSASTSDDLPF